jgi:hypothetical protein
MVKGVFASCVGLFRISDFKTDGTRGARSSIGVRLYTAGRLLNNTRYELSERPGAGGGGERHSFLVVIATCRHNESTNDPGSIYHDRCDPKTIEGAILPHILEAGVKAPAMILAAN